MKHFQDPGQPTPIASRTLLSHPLPQSLDPILLKSNRRKKRLLRSSEQTKFFSIGAWIFNHQSDPCKSKPCNSSSNPVRAHKHFFPPLCRSITPLFTDSHKSALFFFFLLFSLARSSFVHLSTPPCPSIRLEYIFQRDFHRSRGSSGRANPRNFEAEFYRRLAGAGGSPMA